MPRSLLVIMAAPPVLATALMLALAGAELAGRPVFIDAAPRNSAEAAALRDPAAMLQFLRRGDNPSRPYPVRPHIISSSVLHATTLEAALWARSVEMIHLLDRIGAIVDQDQRRQMACLAADLQLPEVQAYLWAADTCKPGEALRRVVARSDGVESR